MSDPLTCTSLGEGGGARKSGGAFILGTRINSERRFFLDPSPSGRLIASTNVKPEAETVPMPTAPAEGEDPEAAKAAKRKKKTDTERQKRAEEAVGRGRQPGQAGRPGGTAQPVAEGPVATSCGESSATAGGGREAQEADGPGEFRHDLITIDREHYLMLVEMASRSLPKDLAWDFGKVMTVQHVDEELGTWDFDMTSLEAARERFCAKRDEIVGDVPTEAPATTAAEEEEAMEQQAYLLRAAAMEEADNARRAMIRGHDGR